MSSLKEIRTRINSVKSTRKITSAMKMVAAAKLKKAQDAVLNLRPYDEKLHEILVSIARSIENEGVESEYLVKRPEEKVLLILITSNKGLCGGFNSNVIKKGLETAQSKYSRQWKEGNVSFYTIGRKGTEFFRLKGYPLYGSDNDLLDDISFSKAIPLAHSIMSAFTSREFDKIEIVYNKFKNAAVQLLTVDPFLPIDLELDEQGPEENEQYYYIFEPSREYIVQELIPASLRTQFYEALLESLAAEHGARMTAMHMATDNATDLIKDLQLTYNKARQAAITNEINEVVSGAEALKD
ncbi:MAG: ATP synthase F1 subunit gamma [Bacteroidales bacterium]|nr:ATP synthase F1 subunit gamma [Bacteroidales bacterium]